jgi:lipopolysaccharide export system permease protein
VIFRRILLREFIDLALAVFVVMFAIIMVTQLVRLLSAAASGVVAPEGVIALLGFKAIYYLPVLLALTLFISVLLSLTRSYRDSEMIVWFSSGISITAWIRPVLTFAVPLTIIIAALSLFLSPWAFGKGEEYRRQLDARDDVATPTPGVFRESQHDERVYFVGSAVGEGDAVADIFVSSVEHQQLGTMVANSGYQKTRENGDRFLVLLHGRRYDGPLGSPEYKITNFEKYEIRIEPYEAKSEIPQRRAVSTLELLRDGSAESLSEFVWRAGLPLSALLLALLAIPLSFVNPRVGRSFNLVLALAVYMVYSNTLSIARGLVAQQKIGLVLGFWGVHVFMLVLLVLLFYRRLAVFSLFRTNVMRLGAKGANIASSVRLNSIEYARSGGAREERVPLHIQHAGADIDDGFAEAKNTHDVTGIEVLGQTDPPQAVLPFEVEEKVTPQRSEIEAQRETPRETAHKPGLKRVEAKAKPAESPRSKAKPKRGESKAKK